MLVPESLGRSDVPKNSRPAIEDVWKGGGGLMGPKPVVAHPGKESSGEGCVRKIGSLTEVLVALR